MSSLSAAIVISKRKGIKADPIFVKRIQPIITLNITEKLRIADKV
jgi:hypothetical protein